MFFLNINCLFLVIWSSILEENTLIFMKKEMQPTSLKRMDMGFVFVQRRCVIILMSTSPIT